MNKLIKVPAHEALFNPNLFRKISCLSDSDVGIPIYLYRLINGEITGHVIHKIHDEGTGFTIQNNNCIFIFFDRLAQDNAEVYVAENTPILSEDEARDIGINQAQEKRIIKEKMIKDLEEARFARSSVLMEEERIIKEKEWMKGEAIKREKKRREEEAIENDFRSQYHLYYLSDNREHRCI